MMLLLLFCGIRGGGGGMWKVGVQRGQGVTFVCSDWRDAIHNNEQTQKNEQKIGKMLKLQGNRCIILFLTEYTQRS